MSIDYSLIRENLKKNNIDSSFVPSKDLVVKEVEKLLKEGSSIFIGGSMSLVETGVIDYLDGNEKYDFHNRNRKGITAEEKDRMSREAFFGDYFIASVNAITTSGEIYEVDNIGNRVAAIMFGPKKVILVVGKNKIVDSLSLAVERVKTIAAPKNNVRLDRDTFCKKHGKCFMPECDSENLMAVVAGACKNTICSDAIVLNRQLVPSRIHIIFVDEKLGY